MEGSSSSDNNKKMSSLSPQDVKKAANNVKKSLEDGMVMAPSDSSTPDLNKSDRSSESLKTKKDKDIVSAKDAQTNASKKTKIEPNQPNKEKDVQQKSVEQTTNEKDLNQESLISKEKATENVVDKNINGDYQIRTMQHDMDEAKGKKVSAVNISKESIEQAKPKESSSIDEDSLHATSLMDSSSSKEEGLSEEGKIGKVGISQRKQKKASFLDQIKKLFARRKKTSKKMTRKKFGFIIALFLFLFIGGIGYYLYASGAFASLSGIGDSFKSLIGWGDDNGEVVSTTTTPVATSTPTATGTPPIIPPVSTTSTSTVPIDDDDIELMPAFFEADQVKILKLNTLGELFDELKKEAEIEMEDNAFKRIGIVAQNNLGSFSLAQAWEAVKSIAKGEASYTELISGEVIDNWGLAMPGSVYQQISEKYNIFLFDQPGNGNRAVLVFKIKNPDDLKEDMLLWEMTMLSDLRKLFLDFKHGEPATEAFQDNIYRDVQVKYLNLPEPGLTIDYAIIPDFNYLILSTSRESVWRTIDKIIAKEGPVQEIEVETQEKTYYNEEIGFQLKYPTNEATLEDNQGGILLSKVGDTCDVTANPTCPMFMWINSIYSAQQKPDLATTSLEELITDEFGIDEFKELNVIFEESAQTNYVDVIEKFPISEDIQNSYFVHNWVQAIGECHYFAKKGEKTLDIVRSGSDLDKSECDNDELFNQILRTFKFTD